VEGYCEYGDEPSGSGATELGSLPLKNPAGILLCKMFCDIKTIR
jgi:hypothetical protein